MKRFWFLIALPALLLVGWPGASELATQLDRGGLQGERRHPKGLRIPMPAGFTAETTDHGFLLRPADYWELRSATTITIDWTEIAAPEGDWPLRRSLGGALLRYRIERFEGGNGGPEYLLQAWKPLAGGHVRLEQYVQKEFGRPGFSLGWAVLEGARRY